MLTWFHRSSSTGAAVAGPGFRGVPAAVGALVPALAVPWALAVPEGAHLQTQFLGFDAVLRNVARSLG